MSRPRTIAIITGARADYGLLRPVMQGIAARPELDLSVWVTGTHLLPEHGTIRDIERDFPIAHRIEMQRPGTIGRQADAESLGRGVAGMARAVGESHPDVVLVLGDRIEALAAAAAASVAGVRIAHLHGGDRAEGIADEAMRHAITKLAHIHLPATETSAQRIIAMGEDLQRVHVVGSPAIDGLAAMPPMADNEFSNLGSPAIIILLHPVGDSDEQESARASELLRIALQAGPTLALQPNHDPGRDGIMQAIERSGVRAISHLERPAFIGLLRRARVLAGNSSAGLIEAAAIPVHSINLGRRQTGREQPRGIIDIPDWDYQTLKASLATSLQSPAQPMPHPFGDGQAGRRTAEILATFNLGLHPVAKRNAY